MFFFSDNDDESHLPKSRLLLSQYDQFHYLTYLYLSRNIVIHVKFLHVALALKARYVKNYMSYKLANFEVCSLNHWST